MTKAEIITQIVNFKFPNSGAGSGDYSRSLQAKAIERCGYTKAELLKELQSIPGYICMKRNEKIDQLFEIHWQQLFVEAQTIMIKDKR